MKKNIAILLLGDFFYDARCINMSLSLKNNFNITIISVFKEQLKYARFENFKFKQIILHNSGILKYWEYHKKVSDKLAQDNYDIIIAGDLYSLSSAALNKDNQKIVYDCREIYTALTAHNGKPLHRFACSIYEKYFLKFANDIIVTANTDLTFLKKKYKNYSNLKWHVIFNYPYNYSIKKDKNLRTEFNIPDDGIIILYQGVIHRGRGIKQLIDLAKEHSDIIPVIIGDGSSKKRYINYAESLNILEKVHFIDRVPYLELFEYSYACDIGWAVIQNHSLSNKYALPNKLFEYLLAGLPVIASYLPNIELTVKNNKAGILVKDNSTEEHINAVKQIINSKKDKTYYQNIAKTNYCWDVQAENFLRIFN